MKDIKKNKWLIISIVLLTVSLIALVVYPVMADPMNNMIDINQAGTLNTSLEDIPNSAPSPEYNNPTILSDLTNDMIDQQQLDLNGGIPFTPSTTSFSAQEFENYRDPLKGISFVVARVGNPSYPLSICLIRGDEWIGLAELPSNAIAEPQHYYMFSLDLSSNPISLSGTNKVGYITIGVFGSMDSNNYYVIGGQTGHPYGRGDNWIWVNDGWAEAPDGFDTTFVTFTTSDSGGGDDGGDDGGSQTPVVNTSISLYITSAVGYISLIGAVASVLKYGMIVGWI